MVVQSTRDIREKDSMILPKVSIIIPVRAWNKNLAECLQHCLRLNYARYEVLVLPDLPLKEILPKQIRVIPTNTTIPSKKRNIGTHHAKGKILAFIDDDAFPSQDWLKNASRHFRDPNVAAVCGPAITPENDTLMQKASGLVLKKGCPAKKSWPLPKHGGMITNFI